LIPLYQESRNVLELSQLKYFQTVARLEHMTQAAQALSIAQPSLSQAIARLEEELGAPLFERRGRNIYLNSYGKAFLAWVERALAALEAGKREVADMAGLERGMVRLGLYTLSHTAVLFRAFHRQYPHIAFRLFRPSPQEVLAQLVRGDIDLALTYDCASPNITWVPLLTEEICLAVPADHRFAECGSIALSEAAHEDFLLVKPTYAFRQLVEGFCHQAGFTPTIVFDGDESAAAIVDFVRAGLGISFFPVGAWRKGRLSAIARVHITEPTCQQTIGMAWHNEHYLSAAAQAFRDFVVAYFSTTPAISETPLQSIG
jgi:LysR family transcriptional regulator, transcription activator of glutamate synthase operon